MSTLATGSGKKAGRKGAASAAVTRPSRRRRAGSSPAAAAEPCPASMAYPKLAPLIEYLMGLNSRADLRTLDGLLRKLKITRKDLQSACVFGTRAYRRNVIAASEHFELLALTWRSGHCTPIHDHKGVSCAFRVVEGQGTEIRFVRTASGLVCPVKTTAMKPGYVCSADENDIHQIANMQAPGTDLITLHIYSPRIKKMNTYAFATSTGAEVDAGQTGVYAGPIDC
ncbi:MAG: cysteine dioxygenase [bacterium]